MFMGGNAGSSQRTGILLLLLFLLPILSTVQAEGGGVLIDVASYGAEDHASTEDENVTITLELHETAGFSANVSLNLRVETLEGVLLSNQTNAVPELTPYKQRNVSATFVGLPYGYSLLTAEVVGDVGGNTSTHVSSITRTMQRLRPLTVSLGGIGSVVPEGVDENGTSTTNLSLHDGDHVRVEFPIINQGDINWSGGVVLTVENDGQTVVNAVENISVEASSSSLVTVQPSLQLAEGDVSWWVNLTGDLGDEPGTHALNGTWVVGPPPLPLLNGELASNAEDVQAGQTLDVALEVWNNGTVPFSGRFVCFENGAEVLNSTVSTLPAGASTNRSFERSAKPMTLECEALGDRLDPASNFPVNLSVEMPSAVFESAGSTSPSLNGGPWHRGDTLSANMLLRNTGSLDGRIRLVLSTGTTVASGDWLDLKQGAAGEVAAALQLLNAGEQSIAWTLESDNGLVSGAQTGASNVAVKEQQSVEVSISDVNITAGQGVEFAVSVSLDEGRDRDVRLQVGYETGDSTVFLQENDLLLQQGDHRYTYAFGSINADRIVAQVAPIDWLIGPGRLDASASIPDETTLFWIEFEPTTNPLRPLEGDAVDVRLTLRQSGPYQGLTGEVWILDSQRTSLAKLQSPSWMGAPGLTSRFRSPGLREATSSWRLCGSSTVRPSRPKRRTFRVKFQPKATTLFRLQRLCGGWLPVLVCHSCYACRLGGEFNPRQRRKHRRNPNLSNLSERKNGRLAALSAIVDFGYRSRIQEPLAVPIAATSLVWNPKRLLLRNVRKRTTPWSCLSQMKSNRSRLKLAVQSASKPCEFRADTRGPFAVRLAPMSSNPMKD